MPYAWQDDTAPEDSGAVSYRLEAWPYRSLPPRGFVWVIGLTAAALSGNVMAATCAGAKCGPKKMATKCGACGAKGAACAASSAKHKMKAKAKCGAKCGAKCAACTLSSVFADSIGNGRPYDPVAAVGSRVPGSRFPAQTGRQNVWLQGNFLFRVR